MSCRGETQTRGVREWLVVGCLASSMSESVEEGAGDEVLRWVWCRLGSWVGSVERGPPEWRDGMPSMLGK